MYKVSHHATFLIVSGIKDTALFHPSEHYDTVLNEGEHGKIELQNASHHWSTLRNK